MAAGHLLKILGNQRICNGGSNNRRCRGSQAEFSTGRCYKKKVAAGHLSKILGNQTICSGGSNNRRYRGSQAGLQREDVIEKKVAAGHLSKKTRQSNNI